jgi:hypothetical protein
VHVEIYDSGSNSSIVEGLESHAIKVMGYGV